MVVLLFGSTASQGWSIERLELSGHMARRFHPESSPMVTMPPKRLCNQSRGETVHLSQAAHPITLMPIVDGRGSQRGSGRALPRDSNDTLRPTFPQMEQSRVSHQLKFTTRGRRPTAQVARTRSPVRDSKG